MVCGLETAWWALHRKPLLFYETHPFPKFCSLKSFVCSLYLNISPVHLYLRNEEIYIKRCFHDLMNSRKEINLII